MASAIQKNKAEICTYESRGSINSYTCKRMSAFVVFRRLFYFSSCARSLSSSAWPRDDVSLVASVVVRFLLEFTRTCRKSRSRVSRPQRALFPVLFADRRDRAHRGSCRTRRARIIVGNFSRASPRISASFPFLRGGERLFGVSAL